MISRINLWDLFYLTQDVTNAEHPFKLLQEDVFKLCHPYLHSIGFNVEKQIVFQACKSRSISKGVVTFLSVLGWQRLDKQWRQNPKCTLHLHQNSLDFKTGNGYDLTATALEEDRIDLTVSDVEPDYLKTKIEIDNLNRLLENVRGIQDSPYHLDKGRAYGARHRATTKEESLEE